MSQEFLLLQHPKHQYIVKLLAFGQKALLDLIAIQSFSVPTSASQQKLDGFTTIAMDFVNFVQGAGRIRLRPHLPILQSEDLGDPSNPSLARFDAI
jgi:hypothetical protein